ncbi:hypothetical protein DSO57_1022657 [Entomophthora muscae]|uniref:Uncharacterized protein n=1 Tax=Entomophthora muscae TaxID=34485 RepID=A0ACC2T386_9FUNG|nr:hypothetical protein DSO57_1022657 [Entomophthora muscae]
MSFVSSQIGLTRHVLRAQAYSRFYFTKTFKIPNIKIDARKFSSNSANKNNQNHVSNLDLTSEIFANAPGSLEIVIQNIVGLNHSILHAVSSFGGLSWFATIIVTTIALRTCTTLPIAIYQQRKVAKLNALKPVLEAWGNTYKRQYGSKPLIDPTSILFLQKGIENRYKKKVQQLYKDYGYSPLALYALPFVQLPLFFSMSFTIRSMSGSPLFGWESFAKFNEPGMATGGISWLYDLTLQDPTMILPFCLVAVHLLNIEVFLVFPCLTT